MCCACSAVQTDTNSLLKHDNVTLNHLGEKRTSKTRRHRSIPHVRGTKYPGHIKCTNPACLTKPMAKSIECMYAFQCPLFRVPFNTIEHRKCNAPRLTFPPAPHQPPPPFLDLILHKQNSPDDWTCVPSLFSFHTNQKKNKTLVPVGVLAPLLVQETFS